MSVKKDKKIDKKLVDISTKNIVTGKRKRIIRKNFSSKQETGDKENLLRITLLNRRLSTECTFDLVFEILMIEEQRKDRKGSYIVTQQYIFNAHI